MACLKVGMAGFEPATTSPPDLCATRLRYIPMLSPPFEGDDTPPTHGG